MVSEVINELELEVCNLQEAQTEDVDDAVATLESVATNLRTQADELERMSNALSDARNILN